MGTRVAVVGAGWAGLAAAVEACSRGHEVTLIDMAHQPGGRARSLPDADGLELDNGQHILIGAYQDTLALMRRVGAAPENLLRRSPLSLRYPDGSGLGLPPGPPVLAFLRGVLDWRALPWMDRLALLARASRWRLQGFRCNPAWTVSELCAGLPASVRDALIDPLCVAALNTPAEQASGQVLLTVLRDALFGPAGSADLLLPTAPLQALLPTPALAWLQSKGAHWWPGCQVQALAPEASGWRLQGHGPDGAWSAPFDQVVLATAANQAAKLTAPLAPAWSARAAALNYEPIVTVWLRLPGVRWPLSMLALHADEVAPAQFGFDLGALGGPAGVFAMVISGASPWVARGLPATVQAVRQQMTQAFPAHGWAPPWRDEHVTLVAVRAEKRATFACTPGLDRPAATVLPGLQAAGDYVAGPYPATLEGAVRAGLAAARQI